MLRSGLLSPDKFLVFTARCIACKIASAICAAAIRSVRLSLHGPYILLRSSVYKVSVSVCHTCGLRGNGSTASADFQAILCYIRRD